MPTENGRSRSLRLHRAVAARLDAAAVARARDTVDRWEAAGTLHPEWARRWRVVLGLPLEALRARLVADDDETADLRQTTPFAGVLGPRERWAVLAERP